MEGFDITETSFAFILAKINDFAYVCLLAARTNSACKGLVFVQYLNILPPPLLVIFLFSVR